MDRPTELLSAPILQMLYDSEINFSLSRLWDGGINWKFGDEIQGYIAEGSSKHMDVVIAGLTDPRSGITLTLTSQKKFRIVAEAASA